MKKIDWGLLTRRINDIEQAERLLSIIRLIYFAAAFYVFVFSLLWSLLDRNFNHLYITEGILILYLANMLFKLKSRFLAVMLFVWATYLVITAVLIRSGYPSAWGQNLTLSVLFAFISYRAIQSTYKYHSLKGTKVLIINLILSVVIGSLYSVILVFVSYICGAIIFGTQIPDELCNFLIVVPSLISYHYVFSNKWPFTKKLYVTERD